MEGEIFRGFDCIVDDDLSAGCGGEEALIADLSTGFGVEGGAIEDDCDGLAGLDFLDDLIKPLGILFVGRGSQEKDAGPINNKGRPLGPGLSWEFIGGGCPIKKGFSESLGHSLEVIVDGFVASSSGLTATLFFVGSQTLFIARIVELVSPVEGDFADVIKGKPVGGVEDEDIFSVDNGSGAELSQNGFEAAESFAEGASEGFFFLMDDAGDEVLTIPDFGVITAHGLDNERDNLVKEGAFNSETSSKSGGASKESAHDIAAAFVPW
jgi:hypothetical protein